jgi:hypothetical protein
MDTMGKTFVSRIQTSYSFPNIGTSSWFCTFHTKIAPSVVTNFCDGVNMASEKYGTNGKGATSDKTLGDTESKDVE